MYIDKLTHAGHPCAVWARTSLSNWLWLREHCLALSAEYTYRYKATHAGESYCKRLPLPELVDSGLTPFVQCVPDQYRCKDAVEAYRAYYIGEKKNLFSWKDREPPYWAV